MTKQVKLSPIEIDTYKSAIVYLRKDCPVCLSEGFDAHTKVQISYGSHSIIAMLNVVSSDFLAKGEVGLSTYAKKILQASPGDLLNLAHPPELTSLEFVRAKVYGAHLEGLQYRAIIKDIVDGAYSDIDTAMFLTACAGNRMTPDEIVYLTQAMVRSGKQLHWKAPIVVDKHCIGGLPGNRTTPIIVSIVTAFGLLMPKTSSRAITSSAGTADAMEVLTPVDLDLSHIRRVVEKEQGCLVWGGSVALSPADDRLIQVERAMNIDTQGQMIASVLSKKIAAGSTHILIDIPVGPTAKVRSEQAAEQLTFLFQYVADAMGIQVRIHLSPGEAPVGRGIGPALEARDVLAVLQNVKEAPQDLKEHALVLAGKVLEFSDQVRTNHGYHLAASLLADGSAWGKFQAICRAQGGLFDLPKAQHEQVVRSQKKGQVSRFDNRALARLAKFAGAPMTKAAGVELLVKLGDSVTIDQPLLKIFANTWGELEYALDYWNQYPHMIQLQTHS